MDVAEGKCFQMDGWMDGYSKREEKEREERGGKGGGKDEDRVYEEEERISARDYIRRVDL